MTVGKSLSRAANIVLKLFDVLFLQMQFVASLALLEKNLDSQLFLQFCFLFEGCLWLILVVIRLCGEGAMVWCRTAGGCSDVRHKSPECSTKVGDGFHRQTLSMMNIHPRKRKVKFLDGKLTDYNMGTLGQARQSWD